MHFFFAPNDFAFMFTMLSFSQVAIMDPQYKYKKVSFQIKLFIQKLDVCLMQLY